MCNIRKVASMKNYYDFLKVFAILLVVIGHITILYNGQSFGLAENRMLSVICSAIYLFHMPLFIALSGAIYQIGVEKGKYYEFIPFLKNKLQRIGVPFLTVGGLFLAPTLVWLGMLNKGGGILQAEMDVLGCMGAERHLWYLPALFWIFMITWSLNKANINTYISFVLSVLVALCYSLFINFNFMCISNGIHYLPYFLFGMLVERNKDKVNCKMLVVSLAFMVLIGGIIKATSIDWLDNVLAILFPCTFIGILLPIAKKTLPLVKNSKFIQMILNQSFAIYLFHVMIIYIVFTFIDNSLPATIMVPLAFLASIFGSILIAYILRKLHLQGIIGEK